MISSNGCWLKMISSPGTGPGMGRELLSVLRILTPMVSEFLLLGQNQASGTVPSC